MWRKDRKEKKKKKKILKKKNETKDENGDLLFENKQRNDYARTAK